MSARTNIHSSSHSLILLPFILVETLLFCYIFIAASLSSEYPAPSHNCELASLITGQRTSSGNRIPWHLKAHNRNALTYMVLSHILHSAQNWNEFKWQVSLVDDTAPCERLLEDASPSQSLPPAQHNHRYKTPSFSLFYFLVYVFFPRFTFTDMYCLFLNQCVTIH